MLLSSFVLVPLLTAFGVAQSLPVADENVSDGQIVVASGSEFRLSREPYEPNIFGVVTTDPAVLLDIISALPGKQSVVSSGVAKVTVSAENGPITPGQLVTSSSRAGIGMKASRPGFVLGVAQEAWESGDLEELGQIEVAISPHQGSSDEGNALPPGSGLISGFLQAASAGINDKPSTALRYAVATVVLLMALIFGLMIFGRVAVNGITAIGRNPQARVWIGLTVGVNMAITVAVVAAGAGLAYAVLAL